MQLEYEPDESPAQPLVTDDGIIILEPAEQEILAADVTTKFKGCENDFERVLESEMGSSDVQITLSNVCPALDNDKQVNLVYMILAYLLI